MDETFFILSFMAISLETHLTRTNSVLIYFYLQSLSLQKQLYLSIGLAFDRNQHLGSVPADFMAKISE